MTIDIKTKVEESRIFLIAKGVISPDKAIVLGTGLYELEDLIKDKIILSYNDIPHFPVSTVDGHRNRLIFGKVGNKNIIMMSGRFHFYEGYEMGEVTYYIHVLKALGITELIITNASGGINPILCTGEIVMVKDHINLFPINPLRGLHEDAFGPRFPDLLKAYPIELRNKIKSIDSTIKEVVYLGWQGPSLETNAEYKMAQIIGADIVGMSSVPEVIVAKYRSIPVLLLSVVSNVVDYENPVEATLEDIILTMKQSSARLKKLLIEYFAIEK